MAGAALLAVTLRVSEAASQPEPASRLAPSASVWRAICVAERLVVPLSDGQGRPYGIFGLSLYHFDPVTEAGHEPYVGSNVTYYPCDALPQTLPDL